MSGNETTPEPDDWRRLGNPMSEDWKRGIISGIGGPPNTEPRKQPFVLGADRVDGSGERMGRAVNQVSDMRAEIARLRRIVRDLPMRDYSGECVSCRAFEDEPHGVDHDSGEPCWVQPVEELLS